MVTQCHNLQSRNIQKTSTWGKCDTVPVTFGEVEHFPPKLISKHCAPKA